MAVERVGSIVVRVLLKTILRNALAWKVQGIFFRSDGAVIHQHEDGSLSPTMSLPFTMAAAMQELWCSALEQHVLRIDVGRGGKDQEMREFSVSLWPSHVRPAGIMLRPVQC
ncbi:MAG: hypothetical protein UX17_C0028G0008 [Parcubacteria group bacterium GW2011_GWC2_45_7]|nr:MAG: hypothetical protein UX17_C0028G0008 [Parcubacteria group bacterium GW2011_GWC2_45_7]KKU73070.1 MAG: hypothetical protein UX98_C0012G0030 [Parcubacteria group bacterium GW2011_GWA2_47_26]